MTSTSAYLPTSDAGKAQLLEHLAAALPRYTERLGVTAQELATLTADAASFRYILHTLGDLQTYAQGWTRYKNLQRDGGPGAGDWPIPPVLDPAPAFVSPGLIGRLSALVARLKTHPQYTPAIGQELWIVGAAQPLDPSAWKPQLNIQRQTGHPLIVWTKGQASALEIWVDRNDGQGFVLMNVQSTPDTLDNAPLPAPGSSAIWRYKAIYRYHDEPVGQWSDVVSTTVGG